MRSAFQACAKSRLTCTYSPKRQKRRQKCRAGSVARGCVGTMPWVTTTLTIPQVAEALGVHRTTVYTLIAEDGLPVIYIRPRCPRVSVEELDAWIARRPGATPTRATVPAKYTTSRKRGPIRRAA